MGELVGDIVGALVRVMIIAAIQGPYTLLTCTKSMSIEEIA